jgi:hypothetical protein
MAACVSSFRTGTHVGCITYAHARIHTHTHTHTHRHARGLHERLAEAQVALPPGWVCRHALLRVLKRRRRLYAERGEGRGEEGKIETERGEGMRGR